MLLPGDRPQVVHRGLQHVRHTGNKGGAAIGLRAHGGAIRPVDVDFGINSWLLAQADDDVAEAAMAKANVRDRRIFHLDVRMREIGPIARDLIDRPHQPLQNVQVVRRLVNQHAAAFGRPLTAPRVGPVVSLIAPAEHHHRAQNRPADLTRVHRRLHPQHGLKEAPLAHDAQLHAMPLGRRNHAVAIFEARGQRLFHQHMHAVRGGQHCRVGVQRMRRADHHRFNAGFGEHRGRVGVSAHPILGGEGRGARAVVVADRRELALRQIAPRRRMQVPHLAATDNRRLHAASGKYWALISRRNLSDATISSMPFMPSSKLIQPR